MQRCAISSQFRSCYTTLNKQPFCIPLNESPGRVSFRSESYVSFCCSRDLTRFVSFANPGPYPQFENFQQLPLHSHCRTNAGKFRAFILHRARNNSGLWLSYIHRLLDSEKFRAPYTSKNSGLPPIHRLWDKFGKIPCSSSIKSSYHICFGTWKSSQFFPLYMSEDLKEFRDPPL